MERKTRVLIVDDSAYARFTIARHIQADREMEVAGQAKDGIEAIAKIEELKPDVVTLDVEMPGMDGITALEQIMATCPTPVVMLSTLTSRGAEITIRALELGAVDFFLKSSTISPTGAGDSSDSLLAKIKTAASVKVYPAKAIPVRKEKREKVVPGQESLSVGSAVIIGCSTGGPRALYQLIPALKADMPAAILIVQHMPPGFTRFLAERLNNLSAVTVKEASSGDHLQHGTALMAPGGYHMVVTRQYKVELNEEPAVCGVRPSVDTTMMSATPVFGSRCIGVILTGMGCDGTRGAGFIKDAGGRVIAEDESTAAIYGMPKSVAEAGYADRIVPLHRVTHEIARMLNTAVKDAVT